MSKVYAFKQKKIIPNVTSGGAFNAIIKALFRIFGANLVVYGAKYSEDMTVMHDRAETLEDCEKFYGSKYVVSKMEHVYKQLEQDVIAGKYVVFSGTPCQVKAVKKYIENKKINIANVFFVDLVCHGTPDKKIWVDFLAYIEKKYGEKVVGFKFRSKDKEGNPYRVHCTLSNGKEIVDRKEIACFTQLFLKMYNIRECCFACTFKSLERSSDITLGDFWGIENIMPKFPRKGGVSQVLVNTEKGSWLFEQLCNNTEYIVEECLSDEYLMYQQNLINPSKKPVDYDIFWKDYEERGFEYIIKKYADAGFLGGIRFVAKKWSRQLGITQFIKKMLRKQR